MHINHQMKAYVTVILCFRRKLYNRL